MHITDSKPRKTNEDDLDYWSIAFDVENLDPVAFKCLLMESKKVKFVVKLLYRRKATAFSSLSATFN